MQERENTQLVKAAERGTKTKSKKSAGVLKSQMCKVTAVVDQKVSRSLVLTVTSQCTGAKGRGSRGGGGVISTVQGGLHFQ